LKISGFTSEADVLRLLLANINEPKV